MLLPLLHLFNDGYLASMPLILPFAAAEFSIPLSVVGLLGSLLSFSGIILALPAGVAATRFGAIRILGSAVLCYGLGFLLLGFSQGLPMIFAAFLLGSIAFGVFHPIAFSAVAAAARQSDIGKDMGLFAATGDIGRIAFAAAVTFIIGLTSWRSASLLYAAVAITLFALCFMISLRARANTAKRPERRKIDASVLRSRRFMLSNAASLLDSFANSSLFIFIPFLLEYRGIEASFIGLFTSIFFIGNLLGKVVMGRMTDRIGKERLLICCESCIFISLLLLAFIPSTAIISALALILGFFTKGTVPITSTMIAEAVDKEAFESAYSINSLSTSIANTVAPLFFGILADILGVLMIFPACGAAALLAAVPAAIMLREKKMMK